MLQKLLKLFCLLILSLLLVSCSSPKEDPKVVIEKEEAESLEGQTATLEAQSRQQIYAYENNVDKNPKEVILKLNAEPLLLTSGYVRLVGVVSGGKPLALIEVSGSGLCVGIGDEVGKYKVCKIFNEQVQLEKGGK
ncbi:MAG: hypothetical protein HQ596_07290 [Candidatus Saganbacteria bacterium]|nr:hypothetical protein [Candidatus Saganbacteria bacterium]